jgi:hypothetical protein
MIASRDKRYSFSPFAAHGHANLPQRAPGRVWASTAHYISSTRSAGGKERVYNRSAVGQPQFYDEEVDGIARRGSYLAVPSINVSERGVCALCALWV